MRNAFILAIIAILLTTLPAVSQEEKTDRVPAMGDRIRYELSRPALPDLTARSPVKIDSGYRIGVGDVLSIRVTGKVDLGYGRTVEALPKEAAVNSGPKAEETLYDVMPDGAVRMPLIGSIQAAGRTTDELNRDVAKGLSGYFKRFTVDTGVVRPGLKRVWVSGQVANPGPLNLPPTATILEALLRADILPEGSTRSVQLKRGGQTQTVDAYGIVALNQTESNVLLQTGDEIFVPAVIDWVTVAGEVSRAGKFELCIAQGEGRSVRARDVVRLSLGLLPTAAPAHAVIARPASNGEVTAIHVNLTGDGDLEIKPGDELIVPSVADYQPTIRLVGEFNDSIYQRIPGQTILNRSSIYKLAAGETVGDVIRRTGGTTPQANLKRARVQRQSDGKQEIIPLDLERVLVYNDKSADLVLLSGDTVELPALVDKVYVFGQVPKPGGMPYEPGRRMMDYLAGAGGPLTRAKSSVLIIRGSADRPETMNVSLKRGMKGEEKDNPAMEPGDVIYLPQDTIKDWRDVWQIVSSLRLLMLF